MGICYRQGEVVEKDSLKAIEWYTKSAKQGNGGAMNNLRIMHDNGIGVETDCEMSFVFFKQSAETRNVEGEFCLGSKYYRGRGIEQNYEETVKWFQRVAFQERLILCFI